MTHRRVTAVPRHSLTIKIERGKEKRKEKKSRRGKKKLKKKSAGPEKETREMPVAAAPGAMMISFNQRHLFHVENHRENIPEVVLVVVASVKDDIVNVGQPTAKNPGKFRKKNFKKSNLPCILPFRPRSTLERETKRKDRHFQFIALVTSEATRWGWQFTSYLDFLPSFPCPKGELSSQWQWTFGCQQNGNETGWLCWISTELYSFFPGFWLDPSSSKRENSYWRFTDCWTSFKSVTGYFWPLLVSLGKMERKIRFPINWMCPIGFLPSLTVELAKGVQHLLATVRRCGWRAGEVGVRPTATPKSNWLRRRKNRCPRPTKYSAARWLWRRPIEGKTAPSRHWHWFIFSYFLLFFITGTFIRDKVPSQRTIKSISRNVLQRLKAGFT